MELNPLVFDISSDEEETPPAWGDPKGDDYDWLSEVLEAVDKGFDDPDEVVVVGEVNPTKKKSKPLKAVVDDDDDCVVLEGDPDKALSAVNDHQEDSDELIIVGQKGPIACRDFPHPRHDCAKFPFSSTSHEQHCELCHCFVCDAPAPCRYWDLGISKNGHCHANDKDEMWKTLRKTFRLGRNVPLPVLKAPVTPHSTAVPQLSQAPRLDTIRLQSQNQVLVTSHSTAVPQVNQAPRHDTIRLTSQNQARVTSHSTAVAQVNQATRHDTIRLTSQNQAPVTSHPTAGPQLNQAPRHDIIRLTSQNQVSRPTPTRAARGYVPQNHVQRPSILRVCTSSTRSGVPFNSSVGSQPVLNKSLMQPRSVSQQLLGVNNTVIRKDRGIRVSNLGSEFVSSNTMSKRLDHVVSSALNQTAYVPSENITSAHASPYPLNPNSVAEPNAGSPVGWPNVCSGTNLGTYTYQSSSQPSIDSVVTNSEPSQSAVYSQHIPQSNEHHDANQLQNQRQPAPSYGFSDCDLNWNIVGQSNQQCSVGNVQLQTLGSTIEEQPFKELESFLFDNNQSIPEGSLTAELNVLSPERMSFDTGMPFFDIATSWDHLTRA